MNRVVDRIASLRATAGELDGQLGELRLSVAELAQRRQEARARLEELTEVAKRSEAEIEVLRTELHRRRSRLASLKEIQQRYEGFAPFQGEAFLAEETAMEELLEKRCLLQLGEDCQAFIAT